MKAITRTKAVLLSGALFSGVLFSSMLISNDGYAQRKAESTRPEKAEKSNKADFARMSEQDAAKVRNMGKATGNLTVRVKISADNERDNAQKPKDFETDIDVIVLRDGRPVRDASVTVQAYKGPKLRLKLDDDDDDDDDDDVSYEGEIKGYHRAYQIDVIAGEDRIENIQLASPAIHTFTSPTHRQRVPANRDLTITWKAADKADKTTLIGDDFKRIDMDDTGRYTLAASHLDDDDDDDLKLKRTNIMQLSNAGPNSEVRISVENEIELRMTNSN